MRNTKLSRRGATRGFGSPTGRAAFARWVAFALLGVTVWTAPALASHLRYSHITWVPRTDIHARAIDFTVQSVWRRDAFTTGNDRCIDPATLVDVPCTGPGNAAGVGDLIHERQGDTRLNPGDSTGLIGGPGSLGNALLYLVTSIDVTNNWAFAVALDPASLPDASAPYDTAITHIYPATGNYTAEISDCCRVSACGATSAHLNNPDNSYRIQTRVNVGTGNSSPVSTLPPVVLCPQNGLCQFTVPVSDNELNPVTFRLSTASESGISSQPGAPQCPNAATIDANTGLYSWNTSGCTLAGSSLPEPPDGGCGDSDLASLYSTQVMIEEQSGASRVAVDFLIELVPTCELGNTAPQFDHPPTPVCGASLSINPGGTLSFTVQASDVDAGSNTQLNAAGLPSGASMSPSLPASGAPVASVFSWTPLSTQQGQHGITFTATDACGAQTLCSITIDVSEEVCTDGADNDGDSLIDCADPDCAATPCDDGAYCTVNDMCQAGSCVGAARDCGDGNACTADSCNEAGDTCAHDSAALNGSPCEDGAFCTSGDTCAGGTCIPGGATDCSISGEPCNVGVCNETTNQCEPQPVSDGSPCNDGLFCTTGEICVGGSCEGGSGLDCDDGNSCTLDTCDESGSQCSNVTQPGCCGNGVLELGEVCDDGNQLDGDGCDADCTVSTACSFTHGGGTERFVGGCGSPSYGDIQSAVDVSQDGDVVSVCPGSYTQPVVISREVILRSTGGAAVTTIHTAADTLSVRRSGVAIEGLTLISDSGAAIEADAICPLQQASCADARGSNVSISDNVIRDSVTGVGWTARVDCAEIQGNTFVDNDAHIALIQAAGPPAILVEIGGEAGGVAVGNDVSGGGSAGAAVEVAGVEATVVANTIQDVAQNGLVVRDVSSATPITIAANTVRGSGANGVVVAALPNGSQMVENTIDANAGDGITVEDGAVGVNIENNNITGNSVGLGNEAAAGSLDATLNWWNSQTGPGGLFPGNGDTIVNRSGAATVFIEFLCRPFPEGFASVDGVCSIETAELRQLLPGRHADLDPFGRFVVFEASSNMDVDARSPLSNSDGSQEIFLLDRRPRPKVGGVCLGGLLPCNFDNVQSCAECNGNSQCPGDPLADPIVLNGECVQVTQLSSGTNPMQSRRPRITGRGKDIVYATNDNQMGTNPDGSGEIAGWNRRTFEKGDPVGAHAQFTSSGAGGDFDEPAPSLSGRFVAMESNTDPIGENGDGNVEIFVYVPRKDSWFQLTRTTGFCSVSGGDCLDNGDCEGPGDTCQTVENSRPSTVDGKRVVFESTGDLHNDPKFPGVNNPDHNREIFVAKLRKSGLPVITQVTDTLAPVENLAPTGDTRANLVAFSSNGDLGGENGDGNREVFVWSKKAKAFEQITVTPLGESSNAVISTSGRWLVFESTADLNSNGASNRRVFQFDRELGELLTLSRLRFGSNQLPRIRRRRFVTWESTANLTGGNPNGNWVIFVFDRKKDD